MTSSMLAGERRWASARRGGMTVLGKVAVPKPLNLPSQRLENHGLDPNVTILPKGTLSWGSRSSSTASNAWSSSTLSANADGSTGSPTRPSSGGSGTRPSTAGSDRTHESTSIAWGPQSRPSSASGALTSNQTSLASLRPRSAETRPGSSQLSRFAEPSSEKSVPWGPSSAAEKLGVSSSKNDGFSLSSGDFPSLGSERDNAEKNTDSQDHGSHGRPSSSSGRLAQAKEKALTSQAGLDVKSGTANDWRRDGSQCNGDGFQPSNEKWQGEPQHYLNTNIPPQHFDAWRGPPVNAPPVGVWFRGPPGGPPYGTPVAPGGFPVEPFPYYRPQIPPPDLANFQPAPPPGAGPRGHHPKNGDIYRPQMSDAYIRPVMPIRPGFYAGPMAYEGYYGPPMGYCNPNEQDIPFMGMAAGPSVYNRYPAPNVPDPTHTHARAGGHGSPGKPLLPEHMESVHSDETRGPYKVLMKQQNEWDGKEKEVNQQQNVPTNVLCLEKGDQSRTSLRKTEWGADHSGEEEMYSRTKFGENTSSRTLDSRGDYSSDPVKVKSPEMDNMKSVDGSWRKKSEISASSSPGVPQVLPATSKDSSLIQKIEGLNAKARASDGQHDVASSSSREVQKNRLHDVNSKDDISMIEAGATTAHEITHATGNLMPTTHEAGVSGDKSFPLKATSGTAISRRPHDMQGRVDHRGKGRFSTRDPDEWRKKPLGAQSSSVVSAANVGLTSSLQAKDIHTPAEAADKPEVTIPGKDEEESLTPIFDPSDCQAQRIKMREFAKQRAIQLQKEEEERIREQKAKALAKLEELNRRTQAGDGLTQKMEEAPSSVAIQQEHDEPKIIAEPEFVAARYGPPSTDLISNPNVVAPVSEISTNDVRESNVLSGNALLETSKNAQQELLVPHDQSLPPRQDVHTAIPSDSKAASQVNEGSVSRHKHTGYKQKQNIPSERNFTEKLTSISTAEAPKAHIDVAVDNVLSTDVSLEVGSSVESSLSSNSNTIVESSVHQRRKNSRIGKNKHKLDDTSSVVALPSVPNETDHVEATSDSGEPKASHSVLDPSSVQSVTDAKDSMQPSEPFSSLPSEEAPGRTNSQWKSQHSRRMPRNPQANKFLDKFHSSEAVVWAPVRSQNKAEAVDEASQKIVTGAVTLTTKSEHSVQNNLKSKRAEMERYVPKPVAKELAQQGSIPQPVSSSCSQTTCDETAGRAESGSQSASAAIGNVGSTIESRNGDKQNKQGKAHGAWRQRNSVEASHVQGLQHGSASTSNHSKNIQKSIVHPSDLKSEENSIKTQPQCSDEWNICDGWNMPDASDASQPVSSPGVIDQGINVKGKRHPFRGHSSTGNSHSISGGETNKSYGQSAALEICQSDSIDTTKENRGDGERTSSQWQPKSQVYSANNQRGGRSRKGQNFTAESGKAIKKDSLSQGRVHLPPQHDNESSEVALPQPDQSVSKNSVSEEPNVEHQVARRQRQATTSRGRPYSPNQGPVSTDGDTRHEQHFSTGFGKNGNQNNRSGRGHESRGDWSYSGQDNRQNDMPANRERSRHNLHYEYQPVGPNNNSKSNNFEGPRDGFHNPGSRYKERGQNHSKRGGGNFYGGKVGPSE